jgi:hypothetical protein
MNTQAASVSAQQMAICFRTKNEMHTFLTANGRAYLPKVKSVKLDFMKAVMLGTKEVSRKRAFFLKVTAAT